MARIYSAGNVTGSPLSQSPRGWPYDVRPDQAEAWVAAGWAMASVPADASPLALEHLGQPLLGVPVLRGPYVVDFSDIPHDGDKMTLWTPAVGDVLLRLFCDWQTGTMWDHGRLFIGQNVDGTIGPPSNAILAFMGGIMELAAFDNIWQETVFDASAVGHGTTVYFFHDADSVQIQLAQTGGTDPTTGHVEIYALVCRAVAP